jgi:CheY-like chemotaxis protein
MIRESTQHLLALINDILDFSQLQAQRMQLGQEPYALHAGFEDIAKRLKHRAIQKKLQTICSIDPLLPRWVLMDHKRFSQLIDNLLDNALKFTNQGEIALHFKSCELGLRIEVQDSGIGMTPEQAFHIFGRFEKVSMDPVQLYGGTGLGLSISEKLVQLQNGRIGVSSALDKGSLFWVELPLVLTEAPNMPNFEGESSGTLTKFPSVFLVVDDQAVNLLVAQRLLQKIWPDCRVHIATSGQEALLWLQTNSVDMVLMDMFMPEMDGIEATHLIRSLNTPVHSVKIIGLTASSNSNDHKQCLEAGMNDIVFKPLEQDALQTCVLRCWRAQL